MTRHKTLVRSLELAAAAAAVIAMRSARMLAAGTSPTASDHREMSRMVSEKIGAFSHSWWAMASRQQRAAVDAWLALARAWWAPWLQPWSLRAWSRAPMRRELRAMHGRTERAQTAVLASGLAPVHRVATANLRRLSRGSRRR